jgi:hypothetical protein
MINDNVIDVLMVLGDTLEDGRLKGAVDVLVDRLGSCGCLEDVVMCCGLLDVLIEYVDLVGLDDVFMVLVMCRDMIGC